MVQHPRNDVDHEVSGQCSDGHQGRSAKGFIAAQASRQERVRPSGRRIHGTLVLLGYTEFISRSTTVKRADPKTLK
jgi:hypothetical protein